MRINRQCNFVIASIWGKQASVFDAYFSTLLSRCYISLTSSLCYLKTGEANTKGLPERVRA